MNSEPNQNLDDLLNDLKLQYKTSHNLPSPQNDNNKTENLLEDVKSELKTNHFNQNKSQPHEELFNRQIDKSLDSIKAQYQNKETDRQTQDNLIYDKNKQEILIQEQQQQLQSKQLVRQAEQWLANLDPYSEEGMWFNQLAESYSSRLAAAINYLSTINKSSF